jgi:hypothetical protein
VVPKDTFVLKTISGLKLWLEKSEVIVGVIHYFGSYGEGGVR